MKIRAFPSVVALALIVTTSGACNRGGDDSAAAGGPDIETCDALWGAAVESLDEELYQGIENHEPTLRAEAIVAEWASGGAAVVADTPTAVCQVAASATGPASAKLVQLLPDGTTREERLAGYDPDDAY